MTPETDPSEALEAALSGAFDCVVSGYEMSGTDGIELLRSVRERRDDLPFVLFTGKGSERVAGEAVAAGADGYLPKDVDDPYAALASRVAGVVSAARSDRRSAAPLDRMTDAFCEVDAEWRLTRLNERARELLEPDGGDLLGGPIWERVPELGGTALEEELRAAMAAGEPRAFERRFEAIDADLAVDVYPSETGLSVYFRDVTERKERERELECYRRLVDELPDCVAVYDADARYELVNDRVAKMNETPREELVGRRSRLVERIRETRGGDPFAALVEGDRESLSGTVEVDLPGRPEAVVDYGLRRLAVGGEFAGVLGVARDVTEDRRRQRRLERASARFEALYDGSPDMVDIHDETGEIVDVNRVMAAELGYDREELAGMKVWDIDREMSPDAAIEMWEEIEMQETLRLETTYARADGSTFPVEVHVRRIDVHGEDRFLASSRDISDRRAYERRIERENERLDEFASIVSHDLRNPLNVLSGYLRLADETGNDDYFERCERAIDEMERLIDDVLTLARQGDAVGPVEPVAIGELADRYDADEFGSVEGAGAGSDGETGAGDVDVAFEADGEVLADRGRLKRLLENLFRNSVEHGGAGVTVGDLDDGFYVADDGPGISEERRDEAFESGYTTSDTGTGFGLAIVERIAEAHGWEVTLTESESGGARFEFRGVERP